MRLSDRMIYWDIMTLILRHRSMCACLCWMFRDLTETCSCRLHAKLNSHSSENAANCTLDDNLSYAHYIRILIKKAYISETYVSVTSHKLRFLSIS